MILRLFTDENVHVDIIASLRKEGFDVITVMEVGLVAHKDYQILEYAEKEKRTLIAVPEFPPPEADRRFLSVSSLPAGAAVEMAVGKVTLHSHR